MNENPHPRIALFIDCAPIKSAGERYVLGEEWIAPALEEVARKARVQHYLLVPYGHWRGYLGAEILHMVRDVATELLLVCNTQIPATSVLIEVVTPYATEVIRAFGTRA